jgi:hypothetical protein
LGLGLAQLGIELGQVTTSWAGMGRREDKKSDGVDFGAIGDLYRRRALSDGICPRWWWLLRTG